MKKSLSVLDAVALIVGIVVGVGTFKTPSLVAANTGSVFSFLLTWVIGGAISFVGALCYAELVTTYPHPGEDCPTPCSSNDKYGLNSLHQSAP